MDRKVMIEHARRARDAEQQRLRALHDGLQDAVAAIEVLLAGLRNASQLVVQIEDDASTRKAS